MSLVLSLVALAIAAGNLVWVALIQRRARRSAIDIEAFGKSLGLSVNAAIVARIGEKDGRLIQDGFKVQDARPFGVGPGGMVGPRGTAFHASTGTFVPTSPPRPEAPEGGQ